MRAVHWAQVTKIAVVLGAIIATVSQATAIVDWGRNMFRHSAGHPGVPSLESIRPPTRVTYAQYLTDACNARPGTEACREANAEERGLMGWEYPVRIKVDGELGVRFTLRWAVRPTRGGKDVLEQRQRFVARNQAGTYTAWVQEPAIDGHYTVSFFLSSGNQERDHRDVPMPE